MFRFYQQLRGGPFLAPAALALASFSGPVLAQQLEGTDPSEAAPDSPALASSLEARPENAGSSTASETAGAHSLRDLDLMELLEIDVSTATKTSQSLDEAPAIITAITADDIERWGYQSVGEVLRHVVGFYLIDDHITPNVGVRGVTGGLGAESSIIKVMIDGRSVAYRSTSGNWLGVELIPLSQIRQIEIIRGPASALYGADAFSGVVNIITLDPTDLPLVDARLAGGTIGDQLGGRFDVTSGFWNEHFDFMLSAAGEWADRSGLRMPAESPDPRVPSYNDSNGAAEDLMRRSLVVGTRLGWLDDESGHHLRLSGSASGVRRGGDFAQWAQLTAGTDDAGREVGTVVSLGQVRVNVDGLFQATRQLALSSQLTYFQGGLLPADRVDVLSDLYYLERRQSYHGADGNVEARFMPSERFDLIVGSELIYDRERLPAASRISKATNEVLGSSAERRSRDLLNVGTYLSTNVALIDSWLELTGGARYDYHNLYGSQVSGRAGLTSSFDRKLVLKILYGNAYKAPSPYLLFAEPLVVGDVVGNEDLKPQFIHTWESQVVVRPLSGVSLSSGVSYNIVLNQAEFVPQGINQSAQNTATQTALTLESRVDLKHRELLGGYGSFEWVRSFIDSNREGYQAELVGTAMVAYPAWIGRVGAFVGSPWNGGLPLELTVQALIAGPRRAAEASILANGGSFELEPFVELNAGLASRDLELFPAQSTTVALRGKNLLDTRTPDPGFSGFELPRTAREVFLELRHRY